MTGFIARLSCLAVFALCLGQVPCAHAQSPAAPDRDSAAALVAQPGPVTLRRTEGDVPGWIVLADGAVAGYIGSTSELTGSTGYSGRPLDVLVAIDTGGRITGAKLIEHSEPILTLGLSDADISRFVDGFAGIDLTAPVDAAGAGPDMPDIISRATVSTGVIRDSILRTARLLAVGRGVFSGSGLDRVSYEPLGWQDLIDRAAITLRTVGLDAARAALAGAKTPVPSGDGAFIEIWAALADPPTIGRNILGAQAFDRAAANSAPGDVLLFVASRGLYSHRGLGWRRSGVFERLAIVQGDNRTPLTDAGYVRIDKLAARDAPDLKERSLFRIRDDGFDPTKPFTLELTATRPDAAGGEVSARFGLDYALPQAFITAPPPEPEPLWRQSWRDKRFAVAGVAAMLAVLTGLLLFQESLVGRKRLWRGVRLSFLTVTLVGLGWGLNGQLSVVQVVAFVQSLLGGFRWETFLIEPVIFTLWAFVGLGLLFWGRGVFCGWLCPFGALQELTNAIAQRLGVPQLKVPHALHERLWMIKYTLFMAILALSFYSMKDALVLAEAEPFKTAISMRMMRAWPFVLFVLVLLTAGLFIERFYCRYLCPLGAALAIPAKLKIFDWLHRRPQCGRECRLCETKCTVGAIDPLGRINPNECVLCLRCQVVMKDPETCPVLKRRARPTA